MLVLIAFGLNSGDGARSPPTAYVVEPTLMSGGEVGPQLPLPPPSLHSAAPGDCAQGGEMKYSFFKWFPVILQY